MDDQDTATLTKLVPTGDAVEFSNCICDAYIVIYFTLTFLQSQGYRTGTCLDESNPIVTKNILTVTQESLSRILKTIFHTHRLSMSLVILDDNLSPRLNCIFFVSIFVRSSNNKKNIEWPP